MSARGLGLAGRAIDVEGRAGGVGPLGLSTIQNYLEDDWDDNSLTSRSATEDGLFAHPVANEAGDVLIGRYRPVWDVSSGSASATSESLVIPNANSTTQILGTTSSVTSLTCSLDVQYSSSPSTGQLEINVIQQDYPSLDNYYILKYRDNGRYGFDKIVSGSFTQIISSTWGADTSQYTSTLERDSYGFTEIFLNGTSEGTATDTSITESNFFSFRSNTDSEITIDNLVVN